MTIHERPALLRELESPSVWLAFAPPLEKQFEQDTQAARRGHLLRSAIMAMLFFTAFVWVDAQVIPDIFLRSVAMHAVLTPIYVVVLIATDRGVSAFTRESAHAAALTLALLGTIGLFWGSVAPDRGYIAATFALFIVYVNTVMRLRFPWCLGFSLVGVSAGSTAILLGHGMTADIRHMMALCLLTTAAFTLYANYTMESSERRSYLLTLEQRCSADELADYNTALNTLSQTDWLTGIGNRRALETKLEQVWAQAAAGQSVALLMLDVDHFKSFNDVRGHPAGDACLARLASLIGQTLRDTHDMVARYGGEEFAIVLPDVAAPEAALAAERIRQAVEDLAVPHGGPDAGPTVTVSVGVATACPAAGGPAEQLVQAADEALYFAKRAGRNRVHPAMELGRAAARLPRIAGGFIT